MILQAQLFLNSTVKLNSGDSILNYYEAKKILQKDIKVEIQNEKIRTDKPCGYEEFYNKIRSLLEIDYRKKKPSSRINEN